MLDLEGGPTGCRKILQIHPTRRCNLSCQHCYSTSGPTERGQLEPALLVTAITDAAAEGYTVAGFSGGEPTLYEPLDRLLEHARRCGLLTTVTSNGTLLNERRIGRLRGVLDLLAVSLDGIPESHDRIRGRGAFLAMKQRLPLLRSSGIPFGFIFTLTQRNLHELEWVATFALEEGARLLQIHPLEEVGRARDLLSGAQPDETEQGFAYLEALRVQQLAGADLQVHVDLADRDLMRACPARVFAEEPACAGDRRLADLVSPLVIETDGTVVPLQYGFGRDYALGNLHQEALPALAAGWRRQVYPAFRSLCQSIFEEMSEGHALPIFDWYQTVTRAAQHSRHGDLPS